MGVGADWLKRKAALYPQLSLIPTARLGCAVSLNCEETVAPWCGAELMSSEHWGGLRRRCHRREIVMVSCCVIAGMSSHWLKEPWLPRWCCFGLVAGRISRRHDFLAKVSGTVTQCSMCVYLLCWQLPGAQITAHHIRSFCLSLCLYLPKRTASPPGLPRPAAMWLLEWAGSLRDLSTDHPPRLADWAALKVHFHSL